MYSHTSFLSDDAASLPQSVSDISLPQFLSYNQIMMMGNELDSLQLLNSEMSYSGGSSSYGSPTSLASDSHRDSLIQRSVSSQSLRKSEFSRRLSFLLEKEGPVRRVYSAGDLQSTNMMYHHQNNQGRAESPLSSESNMIIEGMTKACRYSPEEKRERIERYKTKRHQRNFNKKIKYECRKTLADSRRRIRGRFARNNNELQTDENEKNCSSWRYATPQEDDDDSWITFLHSYSPNLIP